MSFQDVMLLLQQRWGLVFIIGFSVWYILYLIVLIRTVVLRRFAGCSKYFGAYIPVLNLFALCSISKRVKRFKKKETESSKLLEEFEL